MAFVEQAESLRAKAHLTKVNLPALIGICLLVLGIVIFVGIQFFQATGTEIVFIEQALEDSNQGSSHELIGDATALENTQKIVAPDTLSESSQSTTPQAVSAQAEQEQGEEEIYVHVGGCVLTPGVVVLSSNARVADAIAAAGGFSEEAAPDALNLARVLADGERIIVPTYEEYEAGISLSGESFSEGNIDPSDVTLATGLNAAATTGSSGGLININTATAAELQALSGIGPSTAEKIVADRETNGLFASVDDLKRVSGIGDKKFAAIVASICVG